MLKMITFILCVFYDNFFNEVKKEKAQTLDTRWLRGRLQRLDAQAQRTSVGRPQWWPRPSFPRSASHRSSHHMGPWGLKQRSQRSDRTTEARHIDFKREKRHY